MVCSPLFLVAVLVGRLELSCRCPCRRYRCIQGPAVCPYLLSQACLYCQHRGRQRCAPGVFNGACEACGTCFIPSDGWGNAPTKADSGDMIPPSLSVVLSVSRPGFVSISDDAYRQREIAREPATRLHQSHWQCPGAWAAPVSLWGDSQAGAAGPGAMAMAGAETPVSREPCPGKPGLGPAGSARRPVGIAVMSKLCRPACRPPEVKDRRFQPSRQPNGTAVTPVEPPLAL